MKMNMKKAAYATGLTTAITAMALGLGGCAAGTQPPDTLKVQNVDSTDNKITVTGREEVKVMPNMTEIEYSIYSSKNTVTAYQEQDNRDLSVAIETLKSLGVEEKPIRASSYDPSPIYGWNSSNREVTGHKITTRLIVSSIPINKAGTTISESMAAGVNGVGSVSYFSSNYNVSYRGVLKEAMTVVRTEAGVLAEASGKNIVGVAHMRKFRYNPYVRSSSFSEAGAAKVETMAIAVDMTVMSGEANAETQVTVGRGIQ